MIQDLNNSFEIEQLDSSGDLRVIQVTDSHIFSDEDGALLGLNTRHSFAKVVEHIKAKQFPADFFLATGDLSQDASLNSYHYLKQELSQFGVPCFWVPGNHDDPQLMSDVLIGANLSFQRQISTPFWHIILLDTSVPNKVHGEIKESDFVLIEQAIEKFPNKHLLIVMHHQPFNVGSEWLDNLGIKNADKLFAAVKKHGQKVSFVWGHVHQDFVGTSQNVQLIATPSTCVQFKPGSKNFAAGDERPGYRELIFHSDGRVSTQMHRIEHIDFTVDYSIKGY